MGCVRRVDRHVKTSHRQAPRAREQSGMATGPVLTHRLWWHAWTFVIAFGLLVAVLVWQTNFDDPGNGDPNDPECVRMRKCYFSICINVLIERCMMRPCSDPVGRHHRKHPKGKDIHFTFSWRALAGVLGTLLVRMVIACTPALPPRGSRRSMLGVLRRCQASPTLQASAGGLFSCPCTTYSSDLVSDMLRSSQAPLCSLTAVADWTCRLVFKSAVMAPPPPLPPPSPARCDRPESSHWPIRGSNCGRFPGECAGPPAAAPPLGPQPHARRSGPRTAAGALPAAGRLRG